MWCAVRGKRPPEAAPLSGGSPSPVVLVITSSSRVVGSSANVKFVHAAQLDRQSGLAEPRGDVAGELLGGPV